MIKIKYLILCLFGLILGLISCNREDTEYNEETNQDSFGTLEFYSIKYDFNKKEINDFASPEFKESFENNSDQIIPMIFYPYLDQGTVEFTMGEMGKVLDGLECEVPVPNYENDAWSESQTFTIKTFDIALYLINISSSLF